jgi:hypothetical protein
MEGIVMTENQPAYQSIGPSIPFLKTNEEQAVRVRKRLENVFSTIELVHDVIVLSIEVCEAGGGDFNPEMSHVLRRCGANKLYAQMRVLTELIAKFGGTTKFSQQADTAGVSNDPA